MLIKSSENSLAFEKLKTQSLTTFYHFRLPFIILDHFLSFLAFEQLDKRSMDSFCGIILVFRIYCLHRICAKYDYDVCR